LYFTVTPATEHAGGSVARHQSMFGSCGSLRMKLIWPPVKVRTAVPPDGVPKLPCGVEPSVV